MILLCQACYWCGGNDCKCAVAIWDQVENLSNHNPQNPPTRTARPMRAKLCSKVIVQLLMSDQAHALFDFGMPRVRALAAVLLLHFVVASHDFADTRLPVQVV